MKADAIDVVITGGGGFLGRRLLARLLADGALAGRPLGRVTVADLVEPEALPDDPRLRVEAGDCSEPARLAGLLDADTGAVFHLAAVVSGAAEQDFDLGMRVNLHGSLALLDACRRLGSCPLVIFTSSVAVYGGALPDVVDDTTHLTPQNSYGVQKAAAELLLSDYSRRGYVDGRALRLPTVVVRPGRPNAAASSFASSIIREPLNGERAVCPVEPDAEMWLMSPGRVVDALIHAAALPGEAFGPFRGLALPGLTVSVREMVDALGAVAGAETAGRIDWRADPAVAAIVGGWATRFDPARARALGFRADASMTDIIRAYIDEELGAV